MADRIRIQKALSQAGIMSRRAAEEAITSGRVAVNGKTARLGDRVEPGSQTLTLDGVSVVIDSAIETHLLYKPIEVVSTSSDPQGRTTVVDLVPSAQRLYPVGRLDYDSEGLILVSNDGELTNLVTHPRFGITKTYLAKVSGSVGAGVIRRLQEGIVLEDGPAKAVSARLVDSGQGMSLVEIVMGEGRNREVRRMLAALGHDVVRLVRIAIGPLTDPRLAPGQSRQITHDERRLLVEASR